MRQENIKLRQFLIAALLFAAFLARASYSFYTYNRNSLRRVSLVQQTTIFDPDGYNRLGLAVLQRGELSLEPGKPLTSREPFYPLLLALAHFIFGLSPIVGMALNVLIGVLCCWMMYLITSIVFQDEFAALMALAFAAFFPEWIYFSAVMFREPLIIFLTALWAFLWQKYGREENPKTYLLMGLVFGSLALTRSPMIPLGAAFVILAAFKIRSRAWLKTIGVFILTAFILEGIWMYRNERILNRWVAGASIGGSVMYLSLLYNYSRPEIPLEAPLTDGKDPLINKVISEKMSLDQAEPLFYHACFEVLIHHPTIFFRAFLDKALKLWRPFPNPGWKYQQSLSFLKVVGLLTGGGLMLLGFIGTLIAFKRGCPIGFLITIPIVMTVVYGLFWAVMRYHTTLMVGVIPQAAYALSLVFSKRES